MSQGEGGVSVAAGRVTTLNEAPVRAEGAYVLYWMIAARRASWSFALDRAIAWAQHLGKPLLVLETLQASGPWACARFHRFVIDGMRDNRAAFAAAGLAYHPYVEPARGAFKGLIATLGREACLVLTDDFPASFVPATVAGEARAVPVRVERVDGNGLCPMRQAGRSFQAAVHFRRHLQQALPAHLEAFPRAAPFAGVSLATLPALPESLATRWPAADEALLAGDAAALARLPLDHTVAVVATKPGGSVAARAALARFLDHGLARYAAERRDPDAGAESGLSPYLHWGHLAAHEVVAAVLEGEGWAPGRLAARATGGREGWWGVSAAAESYLDQLVTWRELAYTRAVHQAGFAHYESLPAWARQTLERHAADGRPALYGLDALEAGATDDLLWNAAQRQLREEGTIHGHLRMLWGKRVLAWTPTPEAAFEALVHLNDKYALDGRDPNSYAGIGWVLGRYDRPWPPERPIYGVVRYMSSAVALKKLKLTAYLARWSP